jgi:hypothetical protein
MIGGLSYGVGVALRAGAMPLLLGLRWARQNTPLNDTAIPVPRWGLRLAVKAALDEAFFATELISATIVSLRDHSRIKREVSGAVEFYEARGWIDEPARFHTTPPPPRSSRSGRDVLALECVPAPPLRQRLRATSR